MAAYFCPMHVNVRESEGGKCPVCGMALVRDDQRLPFLRHLFGNPLHIAVMLVLMVVLMSAAMMLH